MVLERLLLRDEPSHFGKAGAAFEFGQKGLNGIRRPFADTLDGAVSQVSNPAREPESVGRTLGEGAVAYALDPPVGDEVNGGFHGYPHLSILRRSTNSPLE